MSGHVLVTGGSGFIGRRVLPLLAERGHTVTLVTKSATGVGPQQPHTSWVKCDLLDSRAVSEVITGIGATHLLHLAWYTEHGMFWNAPQNLQWTEASLRLLRAFHDAGGRRAVVAGTCAEYEWGHDRCDEQTTPLRPASLYGTCKLALWRVLERWAGEVGLSVAWGRIFEPFGPGEDERRLVPLVVRSALARERIRCSHGRQVRDRLYVDDVATAFAALLESEVTGAVNVASGEPLILAEFIRRIVERCGGQAADIDFGAIAARPDEPHILVADTHRLRDELGWRPRYTLDAAVSETVDWWCRRVGASTTVGGDSA